MRRSAPDRTAPRSGAVGARTTSIDSKIGPYVARRAGSLAEPARRMTIASADRPITTFDELADPANWRSVIDFRGRSLRELAVAVLPPACGRFVRSRSIRWRSQLAQRGPQVPERTGIGREQKLRLAGHPERGIAVVGAPDVVIVIPQPCPRA